MGKILFVHYNGLSGVSGGERRTLQNLRGCMRYGECNIWQTGGNAAGACHKASPEIGECMFVSPEECDEIVRILNEGGYDAVFFDTSLYGGAVGHIRKHCPGVRTIVHHHNFEKRYFEDEDNILGRDALAGFAAKCEGLASLNSDFRVFISEEDRKDICSEYGICGAKDIVIPASLPDNFTVGPAQAPGMPYVLFLGSAFYANVKAARFIMEEIAPRIAMKAVIAGMGMERALEPTSANVEVAGFVPSLSALMGGAAAFISPVFCGSGSKIKIAEALMHGKYIIATEESLAGYDTDCMAVTVCRNADDFVNAINALYTSRTFYPENRELYLKNYEQDAVCRLYDNIWKNPVALK